MQIFNVESMNGFTYSIGRFCFKLDIPYISYSAKKCVSSNVLLGHVDTQHYKGFNTRRIPLLNQLTKRISGFNPLQQACETGRLQAACVPSELPWQLAQHFKTNKETG
jgi:hypothetical protein